MRCPQCQTQNPDDARFCIRCGATLSSSAPDSLGQQPTLPDSPSLGDLPTRRPTTRRFKAGDLILRRYRVTGELGQGGMGVVYKCFDEVGGIEVALKALPPELSHNSVEMEEVRENFRLVSRLVHQNIAAVKTLERDPDTGDYYLILECVDGVDLRRWRKQKGGRISLDEALPILRPVAEALDYAHNQKIIHRDVKPSNVMLRPDGMVKVLDFGLAAQIQTSLSRVSHVHYGTSGTGPYMAPEQWRGQFQDAATDQYALAVLTYELLAGHLPFENPDPAVLQQAVLNMPPQPVPTLDPPVWNALARGLAKERHARYPSCAAFVNALATGEETQPSDKSEIRIPKSEPISKSKIVNRKSKIPLVLGLAALVLLGLAGWHWGWKPWRAERARQEQLRQLDEQKRQQAAALRREVETALARDDLKSAGARLAELEALVGAEAARDLRASFENKAGERDVLQRYAEASVAYERVPKLDRGQGFGEKLDELEVAWRAAEEGRKNRSWGVALSGYEAVLQRVRDLERWQAERVAALEAQRKAEEAQAAARVAGADADAGELWGRAETKLAEGGKLLTVGTLTNATAAYQAAEQLYEQARARAGEVQAYRQAKATYEALLDDTNALNLLRQHGGTNWARVQELVKEAERESNTAQGRQRYEEAVKLWPGAVQAARIEAALAAAREAAGRKDWRTAAARAKEALSLDSDHAEANALLASAQKMLWPRLNGPWTNSLGMAFVPVPGTEVLFCIWETRVKDYRAYAQANSDADRSWEHPGFTQGDEHPVVKVSWQDAKAFCEWLTRKERQMGLIGPDQSYRLPEDWEWSVAVGLNESRSGTPKDKDGKIQGVYPWGTGWPPPRGAGNYYSSLQVDDFERTSPVGSFAPNKYGLYDLGGNVWEWCEDFYDGQSGRRVLRGASWGFGGPGGLLSSFGIHGPPDARYNDGGFRVVLVVGSSR